VPTVRGELVPLRGGVLSLLVRIVIVGVILLVLVALTLCRVQLWQLEGVTAGTKYST
jgi:hypothetical protein